MPIHAFVAHAFADRHVVSADELRLIVTEAATAAPSVTLPGNGIGIFEPFFVASAYGDSLPGEIRGALSRADVGIVDLTGLRPNVLYELGFLAARGVQLILIAEGRGKRTAAIPTDVVDILVGFYESANELRELLDTRLAELAQRLAELESLPSRRGSTVWFEAQDGETISLVCSPEPEKSRFAKRSDPNYLFIDNLEDRDALVEASVYLARTHPEGRIVRYASDAIPSDALHGNLAVIGGPGEPGGPGNAVAKDILRQVKTRVAFNDECDRAFFDGVEHLPTLLPDGTVIGDFGYFLRARNPYSPAHVVVLMCGVYTAGTLGATLAFGDHPLARMNAVRARELGRRFPGRPLEFEAFFAVEVSPGGRATCPNVPSTSILSLRKR